MYNEEYSIFPGKDEARQTKLVKKNYAAISNILQQQNINETSVHRSDTDAVTTTEDSVIPERGSWRPPPSSHVGAHTIKRAVSAYPHFLAPISRYQLLSQDQKL